MYNSRQKIAYKTLVQLYFFFIFLDSQILPNIKTNMNVLTNRSGDHFLQEYYFPSVNIVVLRGEGDSNSRGRKTKGLAILRRAGLGHPRILEMGNNAF